VEDALRNFLALGELSLGDLLWLPAEYDLVGVVGADVT
jgi:hypothetical protein